MWGRLFNTWCVLCLLMAAVLLAGYVIGMQVTVGHGSVSTATWRRAALTTARGSLRYRFTRSLGVPPRQVGFHVGCGASLLGPQATLFDVSDFNVPRDLRGSFSPKESVLWITCPLWFAMIVALVSPAVWLLRVYLRRRRALRGARGFGVVQPVSSATQASA